MRGIRIFRIFGIDISINPSWFIILFLIVWSLGAGFFPGVYQGWPAAQYWIVAIVAALLLFASVLVHELAHSLVAVRQGTPVKGITLFLLGGVSNIGREADTPGHEALMAAAGPLTSVVIGVVCLGAGQFVQTPETVQAVLVYLGVINLALAAFNLLPGFPLDGGRLLRAALWKLKGEYLWATRGATYAGIAVGIGLIGLGVLMLLGGNFIGGLWIGFIGWILMQAAQSSYTQAAAQQALAGVQVGKLMSRPRGFVPPGTTLRDAVEDYFFVLDARCLPVGSQESIDGLVCLSDIWKTDRSQWGRMTVDDVMVGRERLAAVSPQTSAAEALDQLAGNDVNQLAVLEGQRLVGFVDRGRLLRFMYLMESKGEDLRDRHDGGDEGGWGRRAA